MRPALQRLLASPSALPVLRDILKTQSHLLCKHAYSANARQHGFLVHGGRRQSTATPVEGSKIKNVPAVTGLSIPNIEPLALVEIPGSWRHHLKTFEQYQYESNVTRARDGGARLIDDHRYSQDWDLWLELMRFRQRHHGSQGAIPVFNALVKLRNRELPTEGEVADEIWERFLQAGDSKPSFREQLVKYAFQLKESTGRAWRHFYSSMLAAKIRYRGPALVWHRRLKEHFPPTLEVYQRLFELALNAGAASGFRKIYQDYPIGPMYRLVIPRLCSLGMYKEAVRWHAALLEAKDRPATFSDVEPLLTHFAQVNDDTQVEEIVKDLIETGVELDVSFNSFVRQRIHISREIMNRELGSVHGIIPRQFSDKFCARLFATRIFSVKAVIGGLEVMGLETIGPLSMRELITREDCDCAAICGHIDHLRDVGIVPDQSKFSRVVRKAALENQHEILRSIVDSDLHPDAYEDFDLQEELLTMYYEKGDNLQTKRTLAIIMAETDDRRIDLQHWNLILRCHMRMDQRAKTISVLERMRMMKIPLTPRSSRCLRELWLSPRKQWHKPTSSRNLLLIVNVMKLTLENGAFIPLEAWRELLRRLGGLGHLSEFQDLALWLADWYLKPPPSTDSGSSLQRSLKRVRSMRSSAKETPDASAPLLELGNGMGLYKPQFPQSPKDPQDYIHNIFDKSAQQGIIAWGFQQEAKVPPKRYKLADTHAPARPRENWTWGLHLLRQLRDRGVPISRKTVAKFCKQRLLILFGRTRVSTRLANRRARVVNDERVRQGIRGARYQSYVKGMEAIWGHDLFDGEVRRKVLDLAPEGEELMESWGERPAFPIE